MYLVSMGAAIPSGLVMVLFRRWSVIVPHVLEYGCSGIQRRAQAEPRRAPPWNFRTWEQIGWSASVPEE